MEAYLRNVEVKEGGSAMLIVDPQVDFHPGGSLGIPAAGEDAKRVAKFIRQNAAKLDEIYVTLDSHAKLHIAHPLFWIDKAGRHPAPFTVITHQDVAKTKAWSPSREESREWCLEYLSKLESQGRFTLTIWPEHCLIGSPGHNVEATIAKALGEWEELKRSAVTYVMKGNNSYTEHYSAFRAEVERKDDRRTGLNTVLLEKLKTHSKVVICGQAKSHCVNFTVRDLAEHWEGPKAALVVLEDACSSVVGFEAAGDKFIQDMRAAGLTVAETLTHTL